MDDKPLQVDFSSLCTGEGIKVAQSGDRHYREGWVCLKCPFCEGHEGNHLGFNNEANVFTCFRCGRHGKFQTIAAILSITPHKAFELCRDKYSLSPFDTLTLSTTKRKTTKPLSILLRLGRSIKLPGSPIPSNAARSYLASRGFEDADRLYLEWGLRTGGIVGRWKHRIIIPITYKCRVVSFQARDITNKSPTRYLAYFKDKEVRDNKDCVYGLDKSPYSTAVVVEGAFGVWRIGVGAVATWGIKFTSEQVRLLAKQFKKTFVLYDPEEREAQYQADRLVGELEMYKGHKSERLEVTGVKGRDPAEFTPREVQYIRTFLS